MQHMNSHGHIVSFYVNELRQKYRIFCLVWFGVLCAWSIKGKKQNAKSVQQFTHRLRSEPCTFEINRSFFTDFCGMMVYCNIWSFINACQKCHRGDQKSTVITQHVPQVKYTAEISDMFQSIHIKTWFWNSPLELVISPPATTFYNSASSVHPRLINMLKRSCHAAVAEWILQKATSNKSCRKNLLTNLNTLEILLCRMAKLLAGTMDAPA